MTDDDETGSGRRLPRREFLRITGAALLAPACGDAVGAGEGTEGSSGEGSSGEPTTGGSATDGTSTSSGGSTGASTSGEATGTSGDGSTGTSGSTGEPSDMGSPPEVCEGEEIAFVPDDVVEDLQRFPTAVLAGSMREESVLIHSTAEQPEPVLLRVWQPGGAPGTVRLVREVEVTPDENGYLRQRVDGLCAGQWYRYGFFAVAGGEPVARGILGEFRTAPAADVTEPLTVALSSCSHIDHTPWPALQVTSDEYYDVLLHLGDMAYNDAQETLADYRANWRAYLRVDQGGETGGLAQACARAGLYCTLDDHEVTNDFNPETIDAQRLGDALTSYFEAVPVTDEPDGFRVWRSYRWGKTAEFIVLDCRTERVPSTKKTPEATYISAEQMAWLKERLTTSPCHFKIVLNSVPITDMPTIPWDLLPDDRWEGYAAQRAELLTFITSANVRNVWFVAGDFHTCFVSQVQPGSGGALAKTREIAVTSGNTNTLGDFLDPGQFPFGTSQAHACLLTFDPQADEVLVRFIDPDSGQDVYSEVLTHK